MGRIGGEVWFKLDGGSEAERLRINNARMSDRAVLRNLALVPMYVLDDLPTGIPIDHWWTWDVLRMVLVSVAFGALFFAVAARGVRKRDFIL